MRSYGNVITRYDDMLYDSRPVTFNEYMSDKYNRVHNELYNNALNKFYEEYIDDLMTPEFFYEFFQLMSINSESFDSFFQLYKAKNEEHLLKTITNKLSINTKDFFKLIFEKTNELLDDINKELTLIDNDSSKYFDHITVFEDFRVTYALNNIYLEQEQPDETDKEFLTYLYKKDSENNTYTYIEENFFMSELEDYVIVLESELGSKIAYNKNGEWFLILDGAKYNTAESKFYIINFINEKNTELIKYIKHICVEQYKLHHRVVEIKNNEYWQPSSIIVISDVRPYKKEIIDLDNYWNMSQGYEDLNVQDIKVTNENLNDVELIGINYINGKAKVRSRMNDLEYEVPFKYLNGDISISEDMTLNNTFINKSKTNK